MSEAYLFTLAQKTIVVVLQATLPILGLSLIVGILVSLFQAVTQIQDMTLSFVPKILSVVVAVLIFGPWIFRIMVEFTYMIFMTLPDLVR